MRRALRITAGLLLLAAALLLARDAYQIHQSGQIAFLDAGTLWATLHPESLQVAEPAIARYIHPYLWHPVIVTMLLAPAFLVFAVPGLVILWLTRERERLRPSQRDLFMR